MESNQHKYGCMYENSVQIYKGAIPIMLEWR